MAAEVKLVLTGLLCVLLSGGLYEHLINIEPNQCEMTYMFQRPDYVPIVLPEPVASRFPQYGLYAYGEGDYSVYLWKGQFTGIPVLFIPGNGGSHKQVRSLASVAYRKSLEDGPDFHFNYFTVDINGELGALYGPVLEKQTEFVAIALKRILELYNKAKVKPESVIVVGHSMGGMVGRAVFTHKGITARVVPLLVTQATPHTRPAIMLDTHLNDFYEKINTYWAMERDFDLKDVVLVTVGGGRNDVQVPTTRINTPLADVTTTTADIPYCWLTADHQAIVWCRQLVLATVRALFDCIDINTRKLTTNQTLIVDVFKYHLAKRVSGKRYESGHYPSTVDLERDATWSEVVRRQHTYSADSTSRRTYLVIPIIPGNHLYQHAALVANGLDTKNWVLACAANTTLKDSRICKKGVNLSNQTKKMHGKMKVVDLDIEALGVAGYTHIIINIPPSDDKVLVWVDVHSADGRSRTVNLPSFVRSFTQMLVEDSTPLQGVSYNVTMQGFSELWQSYRITLKPRNRCSPSIIPMAILDVPWAPHQSYLQNSVSSGIIYMAELNVPPFDSNATASVKFFLNPECTYSILIQSSLVGVFRRVVLLYGYQFPTYCAVHLLLTLAKQLKTIGEEGYCPSFFSSMLTLTPLAVVPFVKIINLILRNIDVMDDFTLMGNSGEELPLLPILLFLGTLPFTLAMGAATWGLIILSGHTAHTFIIKVLGRSLARPGMAAELAMTGLSQVPVLVGVALLSLAYATCGTLALTFASVFYFMKVFRLYENYLERVVLGLVVGEGAGGGKQRSLARLHFHLTLLMLCSLVATLNLPTLIIWMRLARSNLQLTDDPTLLVCMLILLTLCFLWQKKMPQTNKIWYREASWCVHAVAVVTLLFGTVHIYRVSWAVGLALFLVVAHQALAPAATPHPTTHESATPSSDGSEAHMAQIGTDHSSTCASEASTPSLDAPSTSTGGPH